jgi:hypothetical protein
VKFRLNLISNSWSLSTPPSLLAVKFIAGIQPQSQKELLELSISNLKILPKSYFESDSF